MLQGNTNNEDLCIPFNYIQFHCVGIVVYLVMQSNFYIILQLI